MSQRATSNEQGATRKVALAFLAHPDDAEFLCAGTLARLAEEQKWEIHIATATAGDGGTFTQDPWQVSAIRTAESRKAAEVIGARYHCLDERDCFVVYDKPAIRKVMDLFRRIAPTLVFTHAAKDYMMDHEQVSLLARGASFAYAAPNLSQFPLVPGSGVPHLYYCDPIEAVDPLGRVVEPTTLIDISRVIERKVQMLACHESQRQWLREHHGMDEYIEAMKRHGALRGGQLGVRYAEAFVQHRGHAYPRNDLLAELLA